MTTSHGAPFRGFRDDEESPFFCAAGRTAQETWEISIDRLARLLVNLGPLADAGPIEMSTRLLCSWHREIFGELFPEHAGRLRNDPCRPLAEHIAEITSETRSTRPMPYPRTMSKRTNSNGSTRSVGLYWVMWRVSGEDS
jgi:fido (protein-threonine AMPylation protein)